MKLNTHYMFSMGIISLALVIGGMPFLIALAISVLVSILGNLIIDKAGHEITETGQIGRRSPRTHTLPRSIGWGVLSSLPFLFFIYLFQYNHIDYMILILTIIAGIIVGPSHMFLDSLTEKGIYVKKNGAWERAALAHRKFDDPLSNGLAVIAGIVMLTLAFDFSHTFL